MTKYAVTHPGKIGDALYTLPTIKYLYELSGNKVDFYTSHYCRPIKELFEYQSCINKVIISEGYVVERMDMGCQPIYIPTPDGEYDTVFHLGFRGIPDKRLDWFMAESVGIEPYKLPQVSYEFPDFKYLDLANSYHITLASRGETSYKDLFLDLITHTGPAQHRKPIVQIGSREEFIGSLYISNNFNMTGLNLLETCYILSKASVFIGLMSSQLVLANGFPDLIKIVPHDGKSWDMRHVLYSDNHKYLVNPTLTEILNIIDKKD